MESNFSIEFLLKSSRSNKLDRNEQIDLGEEGISETEIRKSLHLQVQHYPVSNSKHSSP